MLTYYLFRVAGWLAARLPVGLLYWVTDRAGWVSYRLSGRRRRILTANLRHVLGPDVSDARLRELAVTTFRLSSRNIVDLLRLPLLDAEGIARTVSVQGWENIEAAVAIGKGLILASIHFGVPDTGMQILGVRGLRPVVLAEQLEPPRLFEYITGLRASHGLTFAPVGEASTLKLMFRTLRANRAIGIAADRDITGSGREVSFFGAPARLPDGHVGLALRTGAPIVMASFLRLPDNTCRAVFEPPIRVEPTGNPEADVEAGMRKVVASMERNISGAPEQWIYFQPVWLD